jgi:hypothetical protein
MREDHGNDTDRSELSGFIRGLNEDEQVDLVALTWLGRGDGDLDTWRDLRTEASRAHNNRTGSYVIGTPMLADYLEEALSQFDSHLRISKSIFDPQVLASVRKRSKRPSPSGKCKL